MKTKFSNFYRVLVFLIVLAMLVLNGFDLGYTVNWYSIILVGMMIIPILLVAFSNFQSEQLSIKAGAIEINFGGLSLEKQILIFLDGVIRQKQWTFYATRQNEAQLGEVFHILVDDMIKKDQKNFYIEIKKWLHSENENQMWFASEIIGYYQIREFKNELHSKIDLLDPNETWSCYQLNCLWAISRFDKYKELNDFIFKTKNEPNINWTLFVYLQMIKEGHITNEDAIKFMNKFKERKDLSIDIITKALDLFQSIETEIALKIK
jgi:hypothetical protein